ncbi:beta-ketoacyl-ACP synthase II [Eubacterium callanderi]|uniref:beta-ketoacyl-ACP synthase II n=1 Tax=Eubacterium callanderi TaxID=53442 RepID=UPI001D072F26|nr:beta-ketoacyl-ACP synthase II [Eubacterium callanderi]MCB6657877.1 beta-ketoacyl-ACP synthase II [Eubacterium callanderi]MCB6750840.1 beta-ketoacyl-ACP synthase II [Eubacterium callanderi]MCB7102455.1 beta-ketoacyl-ACP synthase II [Eubacterium callanderi]MCG4817790.1 beta-ketoacyl-ACP synthase II [Eubacterium callanderi]MCQ5188128.1 beta-ketoacyl-ACP synthase II [Eubacterium callanderi]
MRRVVITGLGIVCPIGNTLDETWESVKANRCGVGEITAFDTSDYKVKLAAEVKDLDTEQYFSKREMKFNERFTQFARIAARQAYADAGLEDSGLDRDRFGVIVGSGVGGLRKIEESTETLNSRGPGRVSPFFIPMDIVNLAPGNIAIDLQARGICSSSVTACASGTNSIGEAFHRIRFGYEDVIAAGGSESTITPLGIAGFQSMRALYSGDDPRRASIPFDKERSGFVMGEGAGILMLEELEHAKARGAKIYAEVVGYGTSCDAHHITAPLEDGSGAVKSMKNALKDGGLAVSDVDYINAHGTSTALNDKGETAAVKTLFGNHAKELMISSTKSMTGHLLGGSGAVEAVITVKALQDGFVPATLNYQVPDPECDLNVVPNEGVKKDIHCAISNSFGFGGHNATLAFAKWED